MRYLQLLKPTDQKWTKTTVVFFLLFVGLTYYGSLFHEPWVDEVQPWIVAQSGSWSYMVFEHPHWDAHPVLWHAILKGINLIFPQSGLRLTSLLFLWIFAWLVLFYSKISVFCRVGFIFSYFFFYQYAIVARSYSLYPVLFFGIIFLWEKRRAHPVLFGLILSLTASVSIHGIILLPALFILELHDYFKHKIDHKLVNVSIPYLMAGVTGVFWLTCLLPAYQPIQKSISFAAGLENMEMLLTMLFPLRSLTVIVLIFCSFLMIHYGGWGLFIIPLIAWASFSFKIYYAPWHEGIFYTWFAICMMKLLQRSESWNSIQKTVMEMMLILIFAMQIKWGIIAWNRDRNEPYSGSKALAIDIQKNGWDQMEIYGFSHMTSSLNYYFPKNIFKNSWKSNNRYYSWNHNEDLVFPNDGKIKGNPDFIISYQSDKKRTPTIFSGYHFIKRYPGTIFWKDGEAAEDNYDLYQRE